MSQLTDINEKAITPAMTLLPMALDSIAARVMLLAIGLQESGFKARVQFGDGPAHGYWQCEKGGGCKGVITAHQTTELARELCLSRHVGFTAQAIWDSIVSDDVLAAGVARLILFADPQRLPDVSDQAAGWACYLRCWRPGKPRPESWPVYHAAARQALGLT